MYQDKALEHIHRTIHAIQRSTFRQAYCFHWDSKKRWTIPLQNGTKYRNFQILCNLFIFLFTPAFIARSCHLATTIRQETPTSIAVTFMAAAVLTGSVPLLLFLRRPSGPKKYIFLYNATLRLEKYLEALCQNYDLNPTSLQTVKTFNKMGSSFFFGLDYVAPLIFSIVSFSHASPAYTAIRAIRNFERHGKLYSILVLLLSGILSSLGCLFLIAMLSACILVSGYGVVCLYLWTVAMTPRSWVGAEFPFKMSIHMHNCLRHVTILHSEVAHDMVVTCLHHAAMVLISTIGLYNIITELAKGEGMSLMLICIGVALISFSVMIETFAIYFNGMASTWSKRFLEKLRLAHGGNKYKRKVLRSLLPNYIALEILSSANTLKNGIQMEYFANYFTRVTDNTVDLLLANK
ncbi:hypothetical protein Fcan01_16036 [Folsomia candida]|uniref:Odorant receptor n=1 Tax=Folsomia candida TaxID=158441 RepID=A0A226DXJ3_FOLCA|nr:hypothetical protein Fcan01_16036 [Folsomia candida]